jgi:hypothetical protein
MKHFAFLTGKDTLENLSIILPSNSPNSKYPE